MCCIRLFPLNQDTRTGRQSVLRRLDLPAKLSASLIGWRRFTRKRVQIRHPTIGQIGGLAMLLAIFLPAHESPAQGIMEQWNLHGPQQYTESSSGPWLDRLRSNSQSNETLDDMESVRAGQPDVEFGFSSFSHERGDDAEELGSFTPIVGSTQDVESIFAEPATPSPILDSVTEFDDESLRADSSLMRPMTPDALFSGAPSTDCRGYSYQVLPKDLMYRSYMAADKEPRMQFLHLYDTRTKQIFWDAVLGGRVGLLRYGVVGPARTEVFQLDLEGAVFARVLPTEPSAMLQGSDYRVGMFGTWKFGRKAFKTGYYHISSHVGDEYLLAHPLFTRINYVRDSLLAGTSYDLSDSSRIYGEIAYALGVQGGAKPLEFQAGVEYTPIARSSLRGAPFFAMNGHLREEFDFGAGINVVSGWNWQSFETGHRLRVGLNYYNGPSLQYEFFDRWENLVGGGIWFDY